MITLVSVMSNLRYLEIGYNRLRQLQGSSVVKNINNTQSVSGATKLQTVNFDGNELEEWNDVAMSLTTFPSFVGQSNETLLTYTDCVVGSSALF